jgi:Helix-turn-helix of DDE superfamily endonuclease
MRQVAHRNQPMSYEEIKGLRPALFKRYCGVKPETFQKMVEVVSDRLSNRRVKTGRPPKLSVEDQVLMTLEYWREYRTFFHLARSWGIHESSVWRTIRRVEDILTKSKAFTLPGKKKLQLADHEIEFVVVDVAETPVERPKKSRKPITAGRRSDTP